MPLREYLTDELRRLESEGLLRSPSDPGVPAGALDVCSNDYLGYARATVSRETDAQWGAGASRLIYGTSEAHRALEREVADWVGTEDALLFSSGYAANVGLLSALLQPGDTVVSDRLNHASIVDGCRLGRATVRVVPHLDSDAVAGALRGAASGRRYVVTESYFSMDGDSPDLRALRGLCDSRDAALLVDEAHALGVLGPAGSGLCRDSGVVPDGVLVGLGKAIGVQGALVAGSSLLIRFLWNRARSFVFTTAPSPVLAEVALDRVRTARANDAARARLAALGARLETALGPLRARLPPKRHGPIFPVVLGSPERAGQAAAALRSHGFLAQAIRPPTVPDGESRLRIALRATLSDDDVDRLASALRAACGES
ncbi:MAG TPA: 8-amino-7-oxononanoate synthase [Polyangiaceae bacterium]|nr:8-amino-7-oxononanoate synthase [Polyangiaceae bacterium]